MTTESPKRVFWSVPWSQTKSCLFKLFYFRFFWRFKIYNLIPNSCHKSLFLEISFVLKAPGCYPNKPTNHFNERDTFVFVWCRNQNRCCKDYRVCETLLKRFLLRFYPPKIRRHPMMVIPFLLCISVTRQIFFKYVCEACHFTEKQKTTHSHPCSM